MTLSFKPYSADDFDTCLTFFDANCPAYFSPEEKTDYAEFLRTSPEDYETCEMDDIPAGAFGLMGIGNERTINWILIDPSAQGSGIGSAMMAHVLKKAKQSDVQLIHIAASQLSAPFFARFDAKGSDTIKDGWGPGLDRIDMLLVV